MMSHVKEQLARSGNERDPTILIDLKAWVDKNYKRPENIYSICKKLCRTENHPYTGLVGNIFRMTKQQKQRQDKLYFEALEKRNQNVTMFNAMVVTGRIHDYARSDDLCENIVALQVASGCRQRDIFDCKIVFTQDPNNFWRMRQHGSSKKRGKSWIGSKYLCLLTFEKFIDLLWKTRQRLYPTYLRDPPDDIITATVNRFNHKLCVLSRATFPVQQPRSGTHVNRAIHAALVRKLKKTHMTAALATKTALGHTNFSSGLHYMYVEIE